MARSEIFTALHTIWSEIVRNRGCLPWTRSQYSITARSVTLSSGWVVEVEASRRHGITLDVWPYGSVPQVTAPWTWSSEEVADEEHEMLLEIARDSHSSTARSAG